MIGIISIRKWWRSSKVRSFAFYMVVAVVASFIITAFGLVLDSQECFYYRSIDYKATYLKMIDVKSVIREDMAGVLQGLGAKVGMIVVYDDDTVLPFLVYSLINNQYITRSAKTVHTEVLTESRDVSADNVLYFSYFDSLKDAQRVEPLDLANKTYFDVYEANLDGRCFSYTVGDFRGISVFDRLNQTVSQYDSNSLVACPIIRRQEFYGEEYTKLMGSILIFFDDESGRRPSTYVQARLRLFTSSVSKLWSL